MILSTLYNHFMNEQYDPYVESMWAEKYNNDVLQYLESNGVDWAVDFPQMTSHLQERDIAGLERQQQIANLASTQLLRIIANGDHPGDLRGAKAFFDKLGVTFALPEETIAQMRELHSRFSAASDLDLTGSFREEDTRATVDKRILMKAGYNEEQVDQLRSTFALYRGIALPLRHPNDSDGRYQAFMKHVFPIINPQQQPLLQSFGNRLPPPSNPQDSE